MSGEWAHDLRDPWTEAKRKFVDPCMEVHPPTKGRTWGVLEVGFGRGINTACALTELQHCNQLESVDCLGLEPHPQVLEPWGARPTGNWPWWGDLSVPWQHPQHPGIKGEIKVMGAPEGLPEGPYFDWLFVDLFSIGAHPGDWKQGLCSGLTACARPGAVLTSYCVARSFRDRLTRAGWSVERLKRQCSGRDSLRARLLAPAQADGYDGS
ncbi:MAG: MnmC family methyltransferase [Planctomycetes bacterium]|nr:MnmC family methyltransferase [Planctomycetota bacterium]